MYFEFGQSLVWIADVVFVFAAMQESATDGVANTASMLESMRAMQEGEEEEEEQAPQLRLQEEEAQKTQVHLNSSDYPMLCLFAA